MLEIFAIYILLVEIKLIWYYVKNLKKIQHYLFIHNLKIQTVRFFFSNSVLFIGNLIFYYKIYKFWMKYRLKKVI